MIRRALSALARNDSVGSVLSRTPVARDVVKRFVGGEDVDQALALAVDLADRGLWVSLERAAPTVQGDAQADSVLAEYLALVDVVAASQVGHACEVAVLPTSLSAASGVVDPVALERLDTLTAQARRTGVALMVGIGPLGGVDPVVDWFEGTDGDVGLTLPALRRRTEDDCRRLGARRIRLVKGGHGGDPRQAFTQPLEIDKSYVRCAKQLLRGPGTPSFATHDPRLIEIVESLAAGSGRAPATYEFAFYLGRQEGTQARLLESGSQVRVYVPYGPDWFERLVGGLAEQPSTIAAAVRSLLPGS